MVTSTLLLHPAPLFLLCTTAKNPIQIFCDLINIWDVWELLWKIQLTVWIIFLSSPGKTRTKEKYRVVYTDHQRLELEKEFHCNRYITIRRKSELAANLGLSERQVQRAPLGTATARGHSSHLLPLCICHTEPTTQPHSYLQAHLTEPSSYMELNIGINLYFNMQWFLLSSLLASWNLNTSA